MADLPRTRLVVFDLDGTLYRGAERIPHASDAVAELRRRKIALRFFTNNSSQLPETLAAKLNGLGIPAKPSEVLTSAMVAAQRLPALGCRRLLVVGEDGLVEALRRSGLEAERSWLEAPDAVLAGICRTLDYPAIDRALQAIRGGARFFATNADATYPLEGGRVQPGAGATVGAIARSAGIEPVVFGKPQRDGVDLLMEDVGVRPEETLVVGDRMETDLAAGSAAGCRTCLVLTGITPLAEPGQACCEDLSRLPLDGRPLFGRK